MARIVSVHSFRGGTGKSNTVANVAALLAVQGCTVGVVDTDIQSPGIHVLFGRRGTDFSFTLNDYLWGRSGITDAAYDVTPSVPAAPGPGAPGRVYLIPSSSKTSEITRVLREGYDSRDLVRGLRDLIDCLKLDVLLIDTHPGINEETLLSIAISNTLAVVMRPDSQDYEGTGITIEVARELEVPNLMVIVNKAPAVLDRQALQAQVERTYACPVAAVLPHSDELMSLASDGLFALRYPNHPVTALYRQIAHRFMA
jgi:MinD-like ATPase involved in chromosome partitioning or flagellar assembly